MCLYKIILSVKDNSLSASDFGEETGTPELTDVLAPELMAGASFRVALSEESVRFRLRFPDWSIVSLSRLSTSVIVPSMLFESAIDGSDCGVDVSPREDL